MNLLCWNCRGLGSASAVRAAKDVISSSRPQILGLIETKQRVSSWNHLRVKLGFLNCFAVDRDGLSGGLAILWHQDTDLTITNFSKFHIDMVVEAERAFRLTLFYGNPDGNKRWESWSLLDRLNQIDDKPWLIMGDLNEVFYPDEALGVRPRNRARMRQFREAADKCGLIDLGFTGRPFTYSNKRIHPFEAKARLDRALATDSWSGLFPDYSVWHLTTIKSDHCPILISLNHAQQSERPRGTGFRFEKMWMRHAGFDSNIATFWAKATLPSANNETFSDVLQVCANDLKEWNSRTFGHVQRNIKHIKNQLEQLQLEARTQARIDEEKDLADQLEEWLSREELYWKQRSCVSWLREGDRNTRFFHARASQRKRVNKVEKLLDSSGRTVTEEQGILQIAKNYFINIFQSQADNDNINWDQSLHFVQAKVSAEMNSFLCAPATMDEIKVALFQMGPEKAPGVDGFPALFFQRYWGIVGHALCQEATAFLNGNQLNARLNATEIVLIPKCKDPSRMEEFRPISLCNVGMKVITKVLANRLKLILPSIISTNQSAFVNGRLITDNILIAHEIGHFIKTRRGKYDGYISLKLDMSKAFDRLEWSFLERMMSSLGFDGGWIFKVLQCIRTVQYRVKLNNKYTDFFTPARGIRQGDPISPYLFITASQWISSALNSLAAQGKIQGIKISRTAPPITHLLFADDSLVFLRANLEEVRVIKETLLLYESLSGQVINFAKSELVCSPNVSQDFKAEACRILGVSCVEKHSKYLGLPMEIGQNKRQVFESLEDKVAKRMQDWKAKLLSSAGREILIKSVGQAIPVYAMQCYKIPITSCDRIQKNLIRFWWSSKDASKPIHWVAKHVLMREKRAGGLGFRNLAMFNDALLLKQAWRILTNPDSLLSQLVKARYFPNSNFFEAGVGSRASHAWRGIAKIKHKLEEALIRRASDGGFSWGLTSSGEFSTKSAYLLLSAASQMEVAESSDNSGVAAFWKAVWGLSLPEKIKVTTWRLFYNALPDAVNLLRRGCVIHPDCVFCSFKPETSMHLFSCCWRTKAIASRLDLPEFIFQHNYQSPADWLYGCFGRCTKADFRKLVCLIWAVWGCRNSLSHGTQALSIDRSCWKIRSVLYQCDTRLNHVFWQQNRSSTLPVISCDGSWSRCGDMGFAAVWMGEGLLQGVNVGWESRIFCSRDAEGYALLAGMKMARRLNFREVTFLSDSMEVVLAISLGYVSQGVVGGWLRQCMDGLLSHPSWRIEHVGREDNSLADKLAGLARTQRLSWSKIDSIPCFVSCCKDFLR